METTLSGRSTGSRRSLPPVPRPAADRLIARRATAGRKGPEDSAQQFVARLRGAARDFAAAAGAESAVVPEAVPPARHRRARCRVVLRHADGRETDLTFLGPVDRPVAEGPAFDAAIRGWLGAGQDRSGAWLVPDADAPDGVAVDLTAWLAAG